MCSYASIATRTSNSRASQPPRWDETIQKSMGEKIDRKTKDSQYSQLTHMLHPVLARMHTSTSHSKRSITSGQCMLVRCSYILFGAWHCVALSPCRQLGMHRSHRSHNLGLQNRWEPVRSGFGLGRYQTGPNSKFKFEFKKMKNFQKFFKNTLRCDESNGVKFSQKFVRLTYFSGI